MHCMLRFLALALTAAAPSVAPGAIYVIDASGNGDFVDFAPAFSIARAGDTFLVRPGSYQGGADLTVGAQVIGDPSGVQIATALRIVGIPAGQMALLRGLDISMFFWQTYPVPAFIVSSCQGSIVVQDCSFSTWGVAFGAVPTSFPAELVIEGARDIVFSNVVCDGGMPGGPAHPKIFVRQSHLAMYDCTVHGFWGWSDCGGGSNGGGYDGGTALDVQASSLLLSNCSIEGGWGGQSDCNFCNGWPGVGGDGLVLTAATVTDYGSTIVGGRGGPFYCGPGNTSYAASGEAVRGSGYANDPYDLPSVTLIDRMTIGNDIHLETRFSRDPQGSTHAVFLGLDLASQELPGLRGKLWLAPSFLMLVGTRSGQPGTSSFLSIPLENDLNLVGLPLLFQAVDLSGRLSNVSMGVVEL